MQKNLKQRIPSRETGKQSAGWQMEILERESNKFRERKRRTDWQL